MSFPQNFAFGYEKSIIEFILCKLNLLVSPIKRFKSNCLDLTLNFLDNNSTKNEIIVIDQVYLIEILSGLKISKYNSIFSIFQVLFSFEVSVHLNVAQVLIFQIFRSGLFCFVFWS